MKNISNVLLGGGEKMKQKYYSKIAEYPVGTFRRFFLCDVGAFAF